MKPFMLQDLESALPPGMFNKGLDYFTRGHIDSLVAENESWLAQVKGTRDYRVTVVLQENQVIDGACNCPYQREPVCKHIAAVLVAIRTARAEAELEKMKAFRIEQQKRKLG